MRATTLALLLFLTGSTAMASDRLVSNLGMGSAAPSQVPSAEAMIQLAMAGDPGAIAWLMQQQSKPLLAPAQATGRPSILPSGLPAPFLEHFYQPPGLTTEPAAPRKKLQPNSDKKSRNPDPIG